MRYVPIVVFVLWSLVCWRWYVCGIKAQCDPATANAAVTHETDPNIVRDTTGQAAAQRAIQPTTPANSTASAPAETTTPTTPQTAQRELKPDLESAQVVAVADHVLIHFPYGSTRRVDDDAIDAYLSELAQALVNTGGRVTLTGHTDGIGEAAANQKMALQRALHVKAILVKKGVSAAKIQCKSKGESQPIATNDNPTGRYKNRRVEVRLK
jgi:outer membrane protein OmpA-like peptidoglycan-associated protein